MSLNAYLQRMPVDAHPLRRALIARWASPKFWVLLRRALAAWRYGLYHKYIWRAYDVCGLLREVGIGSLVARRQYSYLRNKPPVSYAHGPALVYIPGERKVVVVLI